MSRLKFVLLMSILCLFVLSPASAQNASDGQAALTVADQVALNGMITIGSASIPEAGWVVIHAMVDGQPGPTVGIAALQAGQNQNVQVMIDALGVTPQLMAELHTDTGSMGVFEYDMNPANDPPIMQDNQ